jgi:hypothetical protein
MAQPSHKRSVNSSISIINFPCPCYQVIGEKGGRGGVLSQAKAFPNSMIADSESNFIFMFIIMDFYELNKVINALNHFFFPFPPFAFAFSASFLAIFARAASSSSGSGSPIHYICFALYDKNAFFSSIRR